MVYLLVAAMPHVANTAELLALGRDLGALRDELAIAATTVEVDAIVDRYLAMGVFHQLRPAAREVLSEIIRRRLAEIEAAEACCDVGAALAEHDGRIRLLAMARNMSR
jgi:hypothetical protein